jgi:hypothetical protein
MIRFAISRPSTRPITNVLVGENFVSIIIKSAATRNVSTKNTSNRWFSSSKDAKDASNQKTPQNESENKKYELGSYDYDEYEDYQPRTHGEKFWYYSRIIGTLGLLGLGVFFAGYALKELFPGRMSSNGLFNEVLDVVRNCDEVLS